MTLGAIAGEVGMNVSVMQENLARGLQTVSRAVSSRATLPVLANVLLKTENSGLKLTAIDLFRGITILEVVAHHYDNAIAPAAMRAARVPRVASAKHDITWTLTPTPTAAQAEAICSVDGIDMGFIGVNDMGGSIGRLEQLERPEVRARILAGLGHPPLVEAMRRFNPAPADPVTA